MVLGQKLDRKLASFCPIFLPNFIDAYDWKNGFGSDLEKNEKEGVVSKVKNEYGQG